MVSPRLVISLTMALLTGLILAMIGGISFAMHEASIKLDTARGLNYAAAIIHAVAFVWTASIAVRTVLRIGAMEKGETILAKAALLSVLLLLVHLIYLMVRAPV